MQAFSKDNDGVRYLLTVIDVFSKYGWMLPLKTKTGVEVASALKEIFKERKPGLLWVDRGREITKPYADRGHYNFLKIASLFCCCCHLRCCYNYFVCPTDKWRTFIKNVGSCGNVV